VLPLLFIHPFHTTFYFKVTTPVSYKIASHFSSLLFYSMSELNTNYFSSFCFQKVYPIENIVIGADAMKYFPIGSGYYKLRIEGYMNATKIICANIAFSLQCKK
jgi:hypothetical protein